MEKKMPGFVKKLLIVIPIALVLLILVFVLNRLAGLLSRVLKKG